MHNATKAVLAASALVLGGCSAPPAIEEAPPAVASQATGTSQDQNITGSRIKNRKDTDRVVRTMSQQDARNAMESGPRPLNSQ
jgi:starvation-inducible outer membrane lipoprotein